MTLQQSAEELYQFFDRPILNCRCLPVLVEIDPAGTRALKRGTSFLNFIRSVISFKSSILVILVSRPFDMSTEDGEQLAPEQVLWDEGFQRNILNAGWPTTLSPSAMTTHTPDAPITPVFTDGRMAVSVFPPLPSPEYPPMTSHLLPSTDLSGHTIPPSTGGTSAHDAAIRFQSHLAQIFPWPEEYLQPTHVNTSPTFGYHTSSSSSAPTEARTETLPTRSMQGTNVSYMAHSNPGTWEVPMIQRPPLPSTSRLSGPERSKKSKRQRMDPLSASQGAKVKQSKRAAACWRCRKYRKPVSQNFS